jgi:RNA polymerase sigma factor (sigma-70 family)
MSSSAIGILLRNLSGWAKGSDLAESSDAQLLERFLTHNEEAAFADLLRRHGPMVLSVCRRALTNEQDREDVFQATFLLLARKAASIRKRQSVGSWLHGVAHRLAAKCRAKEKCRRVHERQAGLERHAAATAPEAWEELQALLDEAIAELPEKYRTALVLCYLEDNTHEEAARRLGCRLTTLRSRVARGRERLRAALVRRGLTLSSASLVAVIATSAAEAALPALLRIRTLAAVMQCAAGQADSALVSASTAALVKGGLQALSTVKSRSFVMLLLAGSLTFGGAGLLAHQIFGTNNTAEPPSSVPERVAAPPPENKPKIAVDRFGDPLPERAVVRLGTVRFRMSGLVGACVWSPDGKTLAGGINFGDEYFVSLFDPATGKLLRHLRDHQFIITSLAYSPDGRTLASGSQGAIVLWDANTGKLLRRWEPNPGQSKQVWSLAFTPDGKGLISAAEDKLVRLWDPQSGKHIRQFAGHTKDVRCAVLSPDGRTLASAADKEIRLWETDTGKMIRLLTGPNEPVRALAFSPDARLLASGNAGFDFSSSSIWLWETATGKVSHRISENLREDPKRISPVFVRSLAFSLDGKMLAAGYSDYTLRLWDVAGWKKLHELPGVRDCVFSGDHDGGIQAVAFSLDGKQLAFARDNQLALLDVPSGKEVQPSPAHRGAVDQVFFSQDGKRLLTINAALDQQILEWDATKGRLLRQILPGEVILAHPVSFSPDRKIMVARRGGGAKLWDTTAGKAIRFIPSPQKKREIYEVVFSPDGKLLAAGDISGKAVWLINAATGKLVCTVEGMKSSKETPGFLAFSPDGRMLAMADGAIVHLAEVPSGRRLPQIALAKGRYAFSIAISPDGRNLAIPCYGDFTGQSVLVVETATGKERLALAGTPLQVANAAFSPDGQFLAAGGRDRTVMVWDIATGKQAARLEGHRGFVNSLAFAPDGRRLASGSRDATALIWDVSGLVKEGRRRGSLTQRDWEELWSNLGSADAAKAYRAILKLESDRDQSVPLLAERLLLKPAADARRIAPLLAQVDSQSFQERERATKELREIGWAAEPALKKALDVEPSVEVRRRVTDLMENIREQNLRMLRGMEVLERIGTPAARKVLASLAVGSSQARLIREAKAALERLR